MLKVTKFGGSSVAGSEQFKKVKAIIEADEARKIVIVSAAGKRDSSDHKLTDLLYLCDAHLTYGVSCAEILAEIRERLTGIASDLGLILLCRGHKDAPGPWPYRPASNQLGILLMRLYLSNC